VRNIITKLGENGIQFKASKCEFHIQETEHLGFIVNPHSIKMDKVKVKEIIEWEPPNSVHNTQVFVGFVNFYRRFMKGFRRIARPLFKKLSNDTKFYWDEVDQKGFDLIKSRFNEAPILNHYDLNKLCIVDTDTSDFFTSGILSQVDDNQILHSVASIAA